ncbi:MAG: YitT family protein [Lachnospiraceae bacterium]|nr:YitT family protein [Lachnospiraceae bacterium]
MAVRDRIFQLILLLLGSSVAAFSVEKILVPVKILDGGVVGISIIIHMLSSIPLGILTFCLNLPFVLIGAKKMGKGFLVRTLCSMAMFSVMLQVFSKIHYEVTDDKLLATVFGGVILGLGVGIVIRNGGCLDGSESVAILITRKKPSLSVGQIVLVFNVVIYLSAGALFGLDRALYSLLTYFITSKIVDYINTGLDQGKAVMIITEQGRQIADDIYKELGRTVTFMKGEGLISGEKTVLYCVITRMELSTLRTIIEQDDIQAFMTISDVSEILGRHIKSTSAIEKIKKE